MAVMRTRGSEIVGQPPSPERPTLDVGSTFKSVPLSDRERRSVVGVDQQRGHPPVGVGPEMGQHEADSAGRMTATAVRREDVVADVHFVRFEPPPIVIAVMVHPADDQLADDDAELGARYSRALPDEAAECRVTSGDNERDVRRRGRPQRHTALGRWRSVAHEPSLLQA